MYKDVVTQGVDQVLVNNSTHIFTFSGYGSAFGQLVLKVIGASSARAGDRATAVNSAVQMNRSMLRSCEVERPMGRSDTDERRWRESRNGRSRR